MDTQIGCSGYRIDLAVIHPQESSRYILGIECDGAMYHSARSARERDIYRQRFLESKGWNITRIWSRNWWQNPEKEIIRIEGLLQELSGKTLLGKTEGTIVFFKANSYKILKVDKPPEKGTHNFNETIEVTNIDKLCEMKIGVLARNILTKMINDHEISEEEIALMQTAEYSKQTFHIQYPLLRKASRSNGEKILRYWAGEVEAYGEMYFICSEWHEVPQNNDRPYFMKWLDLHK